MDRQKALINAERTVGAALRGRPAWNSVLGCRACCLDRVSPKAGRRYVMVPRDQVPRRAARRAAPTKNSLIERI